MIKSVRKHYSVKAGNFNITCGQRTLLMGVINCTPDSFSKDGLLSKNKETLVTDAVRLAARMINEGADLLDIGGESTRPGAENVSVKEEIQRVIPVIQKIVKKFNTPVSIDTYKAEVAKQALQAGAVIVNCIMGTKPDKRLLKIVRDYGAAVILMHIRGTPRTMQKHIKYDNVVNDVRQELKRSIEICLESGISKEKIIIDPGIGFGKTLINNLELINHLEDFKVLNCPILLGTSRKSFIGKILDRDVNERLFGTIASVCAGVMRGAHIVRVHDITPVKEAVKITDAIISNK